MKNLFIFLALILTASCSSNQPGSRKLVWSDEFNVPGLPDETKWSYDTLGNADGWGNNEWQNYTARRIENSFIEGGMLHIKAIKESSGGKPFSSARLVTKGRGDWLYGRIEVCAKLPGARGIWPAIWMLPTEWAYGGWPKSGEIDIMEHVGYMPDSVFASVHTESYNHVIRTQRTHGFYLPDLHEKFHVYALEWDSTQIRAFVDEKMYFSFNNEKTGPKVWPFDRKFHLLLNVAVGGNWGAVNGVDETLFPQEMIVDYVRIYQ
jgi:beta-glucanase (GH16 family)